MKEHLKNYSYASIAPILVIIASVFYYFTAGDGLADVAGQVLLILLGLPSLIISLLATYFLRNKKLKWWVFIVIGILAIILLYTILIIYVRSTV